MKRFKKRKKENGFGIAEVLVSISIFLLISVALFDLVNTTYANWDNAKSKTVAYNLMQITFENYRNLRDANSIAGIDSTGKRIFWDNGMANTTASPVTPIVTPIDSRNYTTSVAIQDLSSDTLGNPTRKKITVTVGWSGRNGDQKVTGITYLDDWKVKY